MPFRLTYRGPLTSTGKPAEKHRLRQAFHPQLKKLWQQQPLIDFVTSEKLLSFDPLKPEESAIYREGRYDFACVVSERRHVHCELDILFLRPSAPGSIIGTGGDIDNRLKTLFDGLRRPINKNEFADLPAPSEDETPLHCLLSDDALISKITVTTDQLLEAADPEHVHLIINVTVLPRIVTFGNLSYIK